MAEWLEHLRLFQGGHLNSDPSTHAKQFTAICNSSSTGAPPLASLDIAHTHKQTHTPTRN